MQKIIPCIWFNADAGAAVKFYTAAFKKSKVRKMTRYNKESAKVSGQKQGSVMTIDFLINNQNFIALNGGPFFKQTPAVSLFVQCKTVKDVDALFRKLSKGGEVMMPLAKYPFSERYAFFKDRFGVSWQVIVGKKEQISPCFLFVGKSYGKAKHAVEFYSKVFRNSKIMQQEMQGKAVAHAVFLLEGHEFRAMDGQGEHKFGFTGAISFMVMCKEQKEIDYYWKALSANKKAEACGWLQDKFGISWQIVPEEMDKLIAGKKGDKVMSALMKMKKLDIAALKAAKFLKGQAI
jgi:predicted 3-demethylubiquinone-9 3-methyltransferase (glyoxalase superfamily)